MEATTAQTEWSRWSLYSTLWGQNDIIHERYAEPLQFIGLTYFKENQAGQWQVHAVKKLLLLQLTMPDRRMLLWGHPHWSTTEFKDTKWPILCLVRKKDARNSIQRSTWSLTAGKAQHRPPQHYLHGFVLETCWAYSSAHFQHICCFCERSTEHRENQRQTTPISAQNTEDKSNSLKKCAPTRN